MILLTNYMNTKSIFRFFFAIFPFLLLNGCNSYLLDGQDFSYHQKPIPKEANLIVESNISLSLIEVAALSPQVLDSMPKISGATIPADLKNISFSDFLDNSYPEYIIGPGDELNIQFPSDKNVDRIVSRGLKVDGQGEIEFPYLGKFKVSGFTANEARNLLFSALNNFYIDPKIYLSITNFRSNRAFISGSFESQSLSPDASSSVSTKMINLDDIPMTVVQALDKVGVSFSESTPNPFLILNRNQQNYIVDLGFITNNANPNIYIKNNDFLYLPPISAQKIYLTGAVDRDQIISYSSTMTLSEALLKSNIDKDKANLEEIYVMRVNQTMNNIIHGVAYKVDIKSPASLMLADKFYLLDKDIIFVSTDKITRWNQTMTRLLSSLDFINLWKSYKPINSEVLRTQ